MRGLKITLKSPTERIKANMDILALFFFGITLVFFGLSSHSFTLDEIFSIHVSKDWPQMIRFLWNKEANMWLYYLILHFWQSLGTSEFIIRSLPATFAVGSIPLVFAITKHLFSKKVALISVLLFVFNIFYIITAQLARGYSLSLFLTLASTYFFRRFSKNKYYKLLYILSSALSVYAHFYAGFVILSQILIAILTKKLKVYYIAFLSILIFLTPILLSPSIHSHQADWIEKPTLRNLIGTSYVFSGDFPYLLIIFGLMIIFIIPHLVKNIRTPKYTFISLWLITPIISSFLFSLLVKPVFQSVYFLISLPPFVILEAVAINMISNKSWKRLLLVTILVLSILRLSLWYTGNTRYKWVFSNNEDDYRSATNFIKSNAQQNDAIIFYGYYNRLPYEYYSDRNKLVYSQKDTPEVIDISTAVYDLGGGSKLPEPDIELLSNLDNKRVWLLLRDSDRGLLNRDQQLNVIKTALVAKYSQENSYEFPGLKLVLFSDES